MDLAAGIMKYIAYLKDDYHEKIGYISESIKVPAVAGFLLAKVREAKQKGISLLIDSDSMLLNKEGLDELYMTMVVVLEKINWRMYLKEDIRLKEKIEDMD